MPLKGGGPSPLETEDGGKQDEGSEGNKLVSEEESKDVQSAGSAEDNAGKGPENEGTQESGESESVNAISDGGVSRHVGAFSLELENQSRWEHIFLEEDADAPKPEAEAVISGLDRVMKNDGYCDLPTSWVKKISIQKERYQLRAPAGSKTIQYLTSTLELFSPGIKDDGMVKRLTVYTNSKKEVETKIEEVYKNREDRLQRRVLLPLIDRSVETFGKGRRKGLKMVVEEDDRREFHFYPSARQSGGHLDGLIRRIELTNKKTMLYYEGRDDKLVYRSITFDEKQREEAMRSASKTKSGASDAGVVKMAEKFERTSSKTAATDVRKRTYFKTTGGIRLDYHFGDGRITSNVKTFNKEGRVQIIQLDGAQKEDKDIAYKEEFARLTDAERECMAAIKTSDREAEKMVERRRAEEDAIKLVQSIYDLAKLKAEEEETGAGEEEEEEETEYDYLAPFLPAQKRGAGVELSKAEAVKAQEDCLAAMKERLLERAHIIDSRLEEEKAALQKKNANYQRNRDHLDKAEEEEYENFVQEATFRIRILKQRREQHGQQAHEKYRSLIERLLNDKRIAKHIK
mmetsp:Transcript_23831/g.60196  ORF Transcript_23831/g.60196 Transcript_23831/m.60196 type:complete len:573 (-) Transcript_23831:1645-3363(-)